MERVNALVKHLGADQSITFLELSISFLQVFCYHSAVHACTYIVYTHDGDKLTIITILRTDPTNLAQIGEVAV